MNYRHAFHAGNFADVFKHTILIGLLDALKAKPAPFCYIDTHAGAGRYDLRGEEARKTQEYIDGVQRLFVATSLPPALTHYWELLRSLNAVGSNTGLDIYPGSPLLASLLMRDIDRAVLCELQPEEAAKLKALFARDECVGVHERDGYAALGALLPPQERRGLVLIDPPFEAQQDEFRTIEAAIKTAYARWPTGIYAIWYPIKMRRQCLPFYRWFPRHNVKKTLLAELLLHPDDSPLRLNGCGMIIVNPPWQFDKQLEILLPALRQLLGQDKQASCNVEWLSGE
jgi:23S rRNA (adenine2030-N6)-methyltransferase